MQASARVEARLVEAFRGHAGLAVTPGRPRFWRPWLIWVPAAGLVVALVLFLLQDRTPVSPRPEGAAITQMAVLEQEEADLTAPQFVALPSAMDGAVDGDADVVEVEVPRSALAVLGVPMQEDDNGSDRVEAEIALGPYGMPQAVRVLR